jgi:hypothetical protein
MSRVNRGDGNMKPMNENEDSFDMAIESRNRTEENDQTAMTVVDSTNIGRNSSKMHKMIDGDM